MREQIQQLINKFPNNLEIITENKLYLYNEHYENSIKERVFFNFFNEIPVSAYADHIRTASRLTSGHSAEVDSYTLPIYIRTI